MTKYDVESSQYWRVPLVEQVLKTLPEPLSSPRLLVWFVLYSIFSFMCMFCWSLFVILSFCLWPLCCLSFDLWILFTPLVSSIYGFWLPLWYLLAIVLLVLIYEFCLPLWYLQTLLIFLNSLNRVDYSLDNKFVLVSRTFIFSLHKKKNQHNNSTLEWALSNWHEFNMFPYSLYSGEVYSIQHYVIKFVSDLSQVGGVTEISLKVALSTINLFPIFEMIFW